MKKHSINSETLLKNNLESKKRIKKSRDDYYALTAEKKGKYVKIVPMPDVFFTDRKADVTLTEGGIIIPDINTEYRLGNKQHKKVSHVTDFIKIEAELVQVIAVAESNQNPVPFSVGDWVFLNAQVPFQTFNIRDIEIYSAKTFGVLFFMSDSDYKKYGIKVLDLYNTKEK